MTTPTYSPSLDEKRSFEKGEVDDSLVSVQLDRSSAFARKTWLTMDLWILPIVCMFYLLSFLDRTNLGNARVAGFQTDVKLTNTQYSIAITVTYISFMISEIPSNLIIKRVGPHILLPALLTGWGITTTLQGLVKSYSGLLACRFFLGLLEGGVTPGLVLYLSAFYPRQMLQFRVSAFFSACALAGAFSGLLAAAIMNLEGKGGLRGWSWIFILEGIFTAFCGFSFFFLLPRTPGHARFLTAEQKEFVYEQLKGDGAMSRDEKEDDFRWSEVTVVFTQPHVMVQTLSYFFLGTILFSLAYFTPSIVQSLGHKALDAQLFTVPPFALGFVVSMVAAFISDKYGCRGYTAIVCCLSAITGLSMYLGSSNPKVRYASFFFSIPGIYTIPAVLGTWTANNSAPFTRRATAIAVGFTGTNMGGILSTWLFGTISPAPDYTVGAAVLLAFAVCLLFSFTWELFYFYRQNKRKALIRATMTREQEVPGLGDKSAWYVYLL